MKNLRNIIAAMVLLTATAAQAQQLPQTAVLKAHDVRTDIYTCVEREANEDDQAEVVSVWIHDLNTNKVSRLLTTNPDAPTLWEKMKNGHAVKVTLDNIAAAANVSFIPYDTNKILVEGCPDARNVWSYIIDIKQRTACQLSSTSGLIGFSHEAGYIIMEGYHYDIDAGGRSPVIKVFNLDGQLIKQMPLPSDE